MGSIKDARFIIGIMKSECYLFIRAKLEEAGYTITEQAPDSYPSYKTNAPEHIRMQLHNEALTEFRQKYEDKFRNENKLLQSAFRHAVERSYYSDKQIDVARRANTKTVIGG
jgi:hypothetical protein